MSSDKIEAFCHRWKIKEFALFGSVLREDFRADSDVDCLVTFAEETNWSLLDLVTMEQELEAIIGRPADLVERRAVEQGENYIRRKHILETAEPIYVER